MILIVGGDSSIGGALAESLRAEGRDFLATTKRTGGKNHLDLAAQPETWLLPQCECAVFCAAMTKLADCEEQPELARKVNVEGPEALATRLHAMGAYVLLLGTNLAFDGERSFPMASDPVNPVTIYGRLKTDAERAVAGATEGRCGVLRLTKVFGRGDRRLGAWREALQAGEQVEAFSGVPLAPLGLGSVVQALCAMLKARAHGTFHFSAREDVTWSDVAERVAIRCGADRSLVRKDDLAGKSHRVPRHSALGMGKAEQALGLFPQDPWLAVEEALS